MDIRSTNPQYQRAGVQSCKHAFLKPQLPSFLELVRSTTYPKPNCRTTVSSESLLANYACQQSSLSTSVATSTAAPSTIEVLSERPTKFGYPRKRSAKACQPCHQRKIRCDYHFPACFQCRQAHRDCNFGTSSKRRGRAFHTKDGLVIPNSLPPVRSTSSVSLSPSTLASSKLSTDTTHSAESSNTRSSTSIGRDLQNDATKSKYWVTIVEEGPVFSADVDPVQVDTSLTQVYISAFMDFASLQHLDLLPQNYFTDWALRCQNKSRYDKLVVYAVMTIGTIYSDRQDRLTHRGTFKDILHREIRSFGVELDCLQLAHVLLLLALVDFADAEDEESRKTFVRAVKCVERLRLNEGYTPPEDMTVYDFPADVHLECRRRTFWTALLIDMYIATAKNEAPLLLTSDVKLKLPCSTYAYEVNQIPHMPAYDQQSFSSPQLDDVGCYLSHTTFVNDITLDIWHSLQSLHLQAGHNQDFVVRRMRQNRLNVWSETIQSANNCTHSCITNLNYHSALSPASKDFTASQLLYHYAWMLFNKRVDHRRLAAFKTVQLAKAANLHAVNTLMLARRVVSRPDLRTVDCIRATRGPLGGHAVFTAVDIITAAGKVSDMLASSSVIMTLLYCALELVNALAKYWATAEEQRLLITKRICVVFNAAQIALNQKKSFFYCTHSMGTFQEKALDVVYGMDRRRYLRAAYGLDRDVAEADVYVVGTNSHACGDH